jgi:predicted signal transduction protein with EAL and GGDEF domain
MTRRDAVKQRLTRGEAQARFQAALAAALADGRDCALFGIELLDLADISATFGPAATRAMLRQVQRRLEGATAHCVRLGERRFGVLLEGIATPEAALRAARRMCREAALPVAVGERDMAAAVCVGAALATPGRFGPGAGGTAGELAKRTQAALAEARREGPGQCCLYSTDIDERLHSRVILRQYLKQALAARQFHMQYQPIVALRDGSVAGAEALIRWDHPQLGAIAPESFIPVAEESGLIAQIGALALEMALRQAQQWNQEGLRPPRIAVNVSGLQLRRSGFAETVARALAATDTYPEWLELELTEGSLIQDTVETNRVLDTLTAMGVSLTIDDFGTGYASLRYLRDLPVHKLKIDQVFVADIATDQRDARLVAAIVAMARSLELAVVAEGVETGAQRAALLAAGCPVGQGHFFLPPVSADELGAYVARHGRV